MYENDSSLMRSPADKCGHPQIGRFGDILPASMEKKRHFIKFDAHNNNAVQDALMPSKHFFLMCSAQHPAFRRCRVCFLLDQPPQIALCFIFCVCLIVIKMRQTPLNSAGLCGEEVNSG